MENQTEKSLSQKVSKGALWVVAASISTRSLNIISSIVLARILAPQDFGLLAVAMSIISLSQSTTQTGFETALIQKQERPQDFLNTAWTFELARYLIIFFFIFFSAPLIAFYFNEPRSLLILRVISVSLVFQGLRNIGVIYYKKNLDFKKQFVIEFVPVIVYVSVVIPLAIHLQSVWALVWGSLTSGIASFFISYIMHPYRPRLDFNIQRAKTLFHFGKWIFGGSIAVVLKTQGMSLFVGKYFGLPTLGFYERANVFSERLLQQVSEVVWKVGYPAFSQLQDDPNRFKQAYLKTLQLLTFIGIPMAGGLFVLSRDFVHLFLTDKWLPIVPLMQILILQAGLGIINTPASVAFQAYGRPSINTRISYLGVIIFAAIVYPFSLKWGASGAVVSLLLSYLIPSPYGWYMVFKVIGCSFFEFLKPILIPIINTCIMAIIIIQIKGKFLAQVQFAEFLGLIFVGILIYGIMTFIFEKFTNYGIYEILTERIVSMRSK